MKSNITSSPNVPERIRLTSSFAPSLRLYKKQLMGCLWTARPSHGGVSRSEMNIRPSPCSVIAPLVLLAYPFHSARLPHPEFQLPVCCFLPAWFRWPGSWVTPTRLLPNGYVSERCWRGKREMIVFWARSIN